MNEVFIMVIGVCLLVLGIGSCQHKMSEYSCDRYEEVTGIETEHASFSDCYLKIDDEWVHWSVYNKRNIARDVNTN